MQKISKTNILDKEFSDQKILDVSHENSDDLQREFRRSTPYCITYFEDLQNATV